MNEFDFLYLYWIPKLHKNPYKHRYIAGSSKCSTKPLSLLFTNIGETSNIMCHCICQMWIFKNSKEHLANLNSIKTYDFSTLYTTIPHDKLKSRVLDIIDNCFLNKNGERKYPYLVISLQKHCFVKYYSDSTYKYSKVQIKKMLEFLIDNIYVVVEGQIFQQPVGISMDTNCAPLLADLFLYSYEAEFIKKNFYTRRKNLLLWPSIRHFDISTTFHLLTIINFIHNWKSKTPRRVLRLLRI
jgi:hypothetical protein